MKDKTDEEIKKERERIIEEVKKQYKDEEISVIDSFFEKVPEVKTTPLWFLGASLQLLSMADYIYFAPDWDKYRGCKIEHECAKEYGVAIIKD